MTMVMLMRGGGVMASRYHGLFDIFGSGLELELKLKLKVLIVRSGRRGEID